MPSNRVNHSVKPDGLCGLHISYQVEVVLQLKLELWVHQTALTSHDASNLPDPPLKADHARTGNGQLHVGPPLLQTLCGPA